MTQLFFSVHASMMLFTVMDLIAFGRTATGTILADIEFAVRTISIMGSH